MGRSYPKAGSEMTGEYSSRLCSTGDLKKCAKPFCVCEMQGRRIVDEAHLLVCQPLRGSQRSGQCVAGVWKQTVFGSRQNTAKCWGIGRKRTRIRRTESPPVVRGPCRHTGLDVCCLCFFVLTSCRKQYRSFLLKELLAADFILLPVPSHNPKLPQPLCFPRSCSSSVPALSCL